MYVRVCATGGFQFLGSTEQRLAMGSRSPDLHLLRGLPLRHRAHIPCVSLYGVLHLCAVAASTCVAANDDHSVRNAPEAARKPIDYYLPHYISFGDLSSEQIIFFVRQRRRLDTFNQRKISWPWPWPFWPTGLTGRRRRAKKRERAREIPGLTHALLSARIIPVTVQGRERETAAPLALLEGASLSRLVCGCPQAAGRNADFPSSLRPFCFSFLRFSAAFSFF